jgi:threonine/homoserine/homoserine lactone efflux protein
VLEAFLIGVAAGYAIAIPVGPIAVLILRTGMTRGLGPAAAAGAGAATADLVYATAAMLFGAAASSLVAPILPATRVVAALLLGAIAVRGLVRAPATPAGDPGGRGSVYLMFLGLTLVNPPTVIYFVSLALALPDVSQDAATRAAFVAGAVLSSLSWQQLLAVVGGVLHGRLTPPLQRVTSIVSAVIIAGLAVRILVG